MSLKDRIEEWYFDANVNSEGYGSIFSSWPDPLVVNSDEFKRAIEMANGPLVHKKGKTILKIDVFRAFIILRLIGIFLVPSGFIFFIVLSCF